MDITQRIADATSSMNNSMAGGLGLYCTQITESDGSIKYCYHDGATMASSKTYYYYTSSGYAYATYETPGIITESNIESWTGWQYGMTSSGLMIMNEIYAHKITGDLIEANTITSINLGASCINASNINGKIITGDLIEANSIYADNLSYDAVFRKIW